MWRVPLFDLAYDQRETEAVQRVLQRKWLSGGPEIAAFETEFAAYLKTDAACIAVSSCTAALQMALHLHGIGPGDEVIIPALTFVADLNVVQLSGARPVLADCTSLNDWNTSADRIAAVISPRTRAVIVVHYAGWPCDMPPILELCRSRGIVVIEDCAHAVGSRHAATACGLLGDVGCFSFFSNKNLSMGEGGLLVTPDAALAANARLLRSHGMTSMTIERHAGRSFGYDVLRPGQNFRMDDLHAALGRVQLSKLEDNNRKREGHHAAYVGLLSGLEDVRIPFQNMDEHCCSSYHIFPILLSRPEIRPAFMAFLKDQGIQTSIHYPSMDGFSFYQNRVKTPPVAADIASRTVTLPLYPDMKRTAVQYVCDAVTRFYENHLAGQ